MIIKIVKKTSSKEIYRAFCKKYPAKSKKASDWISCGENEIVVYFGNGETIKYNHITRSITVIQERDPRYRKEGF